MGEQFRLLTLQQGSITALLGRLIPYTRLGDCRPCVGFLWGAWCHLLGRCSGWVCRWSLLGASASSKWLDKLAWAVSACGCVPPRGERGLWSASGTHDRRIRVTRR